jgi:multidrug resistance efflux pump
MMGGGMLGAMRAGMGPGMNPGMGMGGGMAGGMNPGMPGGMMAAMMRGGMGRGGMAGGMAPGMMGDMMGGGMAPPVPPSGTGQKPAQMPLFNPGGFLRLLYILFYPLKLILWMILPLVVLAGMSIFENFSAFGADIATVFTDYSSIMRIAIGLFVVNIASRLAQGVAIVAHGGKVKALGLTLMLGILPRFYIDRDGIADLDRRGQLWAHGAPMLARLTLFALGTLIWAITREQGGMLPVIALITAQFSLITFLLVSWPFMLADGTRWLSVLLNEPRLVPRAALAFRHVFLRGRLPPTIQRKDALTLALYAVGAIISISLVIGTLATFLLLYLERSLDGLGVLIYLGIATAFTFWLIALWASVKARRPGGANGAAFDKAAFRQLLGARFADAGPGAGPETAAATDPAALIAPAPAEEPLVSAQAKVIWSVILVALAILAFQPYTYETGGQVEILPTARAQAVARTEGEIIAVTVAEGDIVAAGQLLGHLSSWDQERQVSVTEAQLAAAEANLARLLDHPKPEEVEVARRQVESARASVAYSTIEAERTRELAATGAGSQQAAERAQSLLDADLANLAVAEANLDLVMSGATENDIAIAQAEVDRLSVELAFQRDELERTRIVAPMAGRVVTSNLQLLTGSYLRVGNPLLEIENVDVVNAVIAIPESDIPLVAPGDAVRLKALGQSDTEIIGTVQAIAPAVQQESYGSIVRVTVLFPNPDGILRSGMTGYAKIEGAEMRAWEAYLRSIMRFFQVEVWSWIP